MGVGREDCSRLPVSLNMRAVKPVKLETPFKITAVMSLPRTHWTANFRCSQQLAPLGIPLQAFEGVYWAQCLERGFDKLIAEGMDAILTDRLRHGLYRATRADADASDAAQPARRRDLRHAVRARLEFGSRDGRSAGRRSRRMCRARCSMRIS
jgi:hypothetical protein